MSARRDRSALDRVYQASYEELLGLAEPLAENSKAYPSEQRTCCSAWFSGGLEL